jgi:parallel beta-helix repeat protein
MGDNPTGRTVETSVTMRAFEGSARNVTISNLTIEKYANPAQQGAVFGYSSQGWVVANNVVRWNHGGGIQIGHGMQVLRNIVTANGQLGISGTGNDVLIEENEISFNNGSGFDYYWEAGGSKWVKTDRLIVRRNFSHHNRGFGLWTDIDNINTLYEGNRVEDNDLAGIFHEISYRATIRGNTSRRNGGAAGGGGYGAGILTSSSSDVEIVGNTVADNPHGIWGVQENRGSGAFGVYRLVNLYVHDNTVTMAQGFTGLLQYINSNDVFTAHNNRFTNNTYYLGPNARYFRWMNGDRTDAEWQAYNQDVDGQFIR